MDIAFITVNYNTKQLLEDVVTFFNGTTFPFNYCLVVVDNNSVDGSADFLRGARGVIPILNRDNVGYGRAVNQGVAASDSSYICVLNTDLILNREAVVALWNHLESQPEVGLACPLICDPGTMQLQNFMFHESLIELYVDTIFRWKGRDLKRRVSETRKPVVVEGVMGSFLFFRRNLAEGDTLFDEAFNFYYEDNDLAHRLKDRGVRCDVLPQQRIVHLGGQSSSALSTNRVLTANRYRYLLKHYGAWHANNIFRQNILRNWLKILKYRLKSMLCGQEAMESKISMQKNICDEFRSVMQLSYRRAAAAETESP
jgi:GT2 family glycosyltransferase